MSAPLRPNFIDLRSQSQASVSRPLKSPRLHVAGEVPPELSPLDAFALQSRLLAKQLEDSAKSGNRVSRLPPLTTESPLIVQGRSDYFRSMSYDGPDSDTLDNGQDQPRSAVSQPMTPSVYNRTPEVEEPLIRPQSMHPRMSRIPPTPDHNGPPPVPHYAQDRQRRMQHAYTPSDDDESFFGFGVRRERSPSPLIEESEQQVSGEELDVSVQVLTEVSAEASAELSPGAPAEEEQSVADDHFRPLQPVQSYQSSHSWQSNQSNANSVYTEQLSHEPTPTTSVLPISHSGPSPFTQSPERVFAHGNSFDSASGGLAPPRTLFPKRSSSIMSVPLETTEQDNHSVMSGSFYSMDAPRKLSTSSFSVASPGSGSFQRSPSICSDMSAPLPRPSFNFSRPLSRVSTNGFESPARQASSDSHTSYSQSSFAVGEDANTPVSVHSEGFPDQSAFFEDGRAAPSYIYSKFSLPRGKMIRRSNTHGTDSPPTASSHWEQPMVAPGNVQNSPYGGHAPPSPPTRPSSSGNLMPRPSLERSKLSTEVLPQGFQPSPNPSRASTDGGRSSEDVPRGRMMTTANEGGTRGRTPLSITTNNTSDSASTIKARSVNTLATAAEIPAEEHVDKAIKLHESGQLNESTYHLRHAARQGHPTGMLLYALACRHGWGMRANPKEGAEWLRKAADCASIEIADDEAQMKEGKTVDVIERKTRKAQFALSIYELGVSYMNGWGIDQDKVLALKCFEIAGSWGDVDALAEAGFCYAQGMGCKKDMKRSAQYYREAEAKGMSMVGNSWIHKAKYDDDSKSIKDGKTRSKSKSRHMFGKKHA